MQGFDNLDATELQALLEAPAKIMLLIAGADGEIDQEERYWSNRILKARTYTKPVELNAFYEKVSASFLAKTEEFLKFYPHDPELRNEMLAKELETLNPILAKIDTFLAAKLYKGFIALALETAQASGGFLRFGATSALEKKWVELPMLHEISMPEGYVEEEEEEKDIWE